MVHETHHTSLKTLGMALLPGLVLLGAPVQASDVSANLLTRYQLMTLSQRAGEAQAMSSISAALFQGMDLGQWQGVTRQAMLPDFADSLGYQYYDLGLLASRQALFEPDFVVPLGLRGRSHMLTIDFSSVEVPQSPFLSHQDRSILADLTSRSHTSSIAPGFRTPFLENSYVDVAAVFAQQDYASWNLNSQVGMSPIERNEWLETSRGTGVRLGVNSEIAENVAIGATYQSRINMDTLLTYQGVYSEPGDFDIPASANFGLMVQATPTASLSFDVQRVLYSEVNPVTSQQLPDRFLSLLGDSDSPDFGWQDLTIYSVGWNWQPSEDLAWEFSYSTSQQPTPDSSVLANAVESEYSDRNMSVGFSKRLSPYAQFRFSASYSPQEIFLNALSFQRPGDPDEENIEARFQVQFDF